MAQHLHRDVLDTLKRPYAYVSCLELQKRSVILRAVMNQLKVPHHS